MIGYPDAPLVRDLDFVDDELGLVAADHLDEGAGVFRTTDGGQSWPKRCDCGSDAVVFLDDDIALAGGSGLWRSTDAGRTWTRVREGLGEGYVSNPAFASGGEGLLSGSGGAFTTADGGASWQRASSGLLVHLTSIAMRDAERGVAAGEDGMVLTTSDGGETWRGSLAGLAGPFSGRLTGISFVGEEFVAVGGEDGSAFTSDDGGRTWTNVGIPALPMLFHPSDIEFVTTEKGWVVGLDDNTATDGLDVIFHTTDGG